MDAPETSGDRLLDLVVLAPRSRAVHCRVLGSERRITLRSRELWDFVSGEIVTVRVSNRWSYAGHPYVAGEVESRRVDAKALGLVPLRLLDEWLWHPEEHDWGEEGEPLVAWEARIIARGARPSFEMEQVLPGADPEDWDSDPILEAGELNAAGDRLGARKLLIDMLAADLRCLDAHAHLGNFSFDRDPERALRHYEVGVRIGEFSLGDGFDGLLPWGRTDNRPFLRAMHGFGLCLWRLGRFDEAGDVFERMLWLNPTDNQGIRSLLPDVRARKEWEED
jgi:hypothetical protein